MHFHHRQAGTTALVLVGACCLALAVAGCNSSSRLGQTVPVVGRVTVDGDPVKAGSVSFRPDRSKGNANLDEPYGEIDSQGNYKLFTGKKEGAAVGWYRVAVFAGEPASEGNTSGQARWFANPKYASVESSELTVQVVENPDTGAYDLKLTK